MHQQDLTEVFAELNRSGTSPGVIDLLSKFYDLFKPTDKTEQARYFESTEGVFQRMLEIYPGEDLTLDVVYFFLNGAGYSLKNMSETGVEMRWLLKDAR